MKMDAMCIIQVKLLLVNNYEKTFRDLDYRILKDKLDTELDRFEIKQRFSVYVTRKLA